MATRELKNIFLSASIPLQDRDPKYFRTADIISIRDSVIALASVAIPTYNLVWGGHPSITPLITGVLNHFEIDVKSHVTLYQSHFFDKNLPPENKYVEKLIRTDIKCNDREESLLHMRQRMLDENDFFAGVFIGGMGGVEDEYNMFIEKYPDAIVLPIASTGAAAKFIYEKDKDKFDVRLEKDLAYSSLFKDLLKL